MRVLVIDEEIPFPLNTGKRLRTFNLLKRLQEKHQITYVCYGDGTAEIPKLPNLKFIIVKNIILEQKGVPFHWSLFRNLFSHHPYIVERHYSDLMRREIASLVRSKPFDLIHCEWTPYTENIKEIVAELPSVLSAHNVESQIWCRYFTAEKNFIKKQYIYLQWQRVHAYERLASQCYKEVMTVSEPDKRVFETEYGCGNVTVVPNGVDEDYFAPVEAQVRQYSMVFTGSMDWRPNQDGVKFFIKEIFPQIRKELPEATFTIVGRKPPQWLKDIAKTHKGIEITGTVDDVRPYIAQSALYIVPLRIGGGSRLKILEALSMEKTVLSTTVGAEGLETRDGIHLLLRDTPQVFAATAVQVLTNPGHYTDLGLEGRKLIIKQYTWDTIAGVMENVWQKAFAGYRR